MKPILKILSYLLILMLLTSEDCSDEAHRPAVVEQQTSMFDQLQNNFTATEPDKEFLQAMEQKAIQKFKELIDYINISSDTAYNVEFRREARNVLSEGFISASDVKVFLTYLGLHEDSSNTILINPAVGINRFNVDSVRYVQSLIQTGDSEFSGKMSYKISDQSEAYKGRLDVVLKKVPKQFGDTELMVWEQFFKL